MKWRVYGIVTGSKFLGVFEADTKEQAEELAAGDAWVSICHQCANEIDDPQITDIQCEPEDD